MLSGSVAKSTIDNEDELHVEAVPMLERLAVGESGGYCFPVSFSKSLTDKTVSMRVLHSFRE
jgi:hypothetical protein